MFKNIRIPKRGGGSRLQRVQVLASGKYKFVKNPSKSRSKVTKTTKGKKKGGKKMAKKKRRGRRSFTIPIAPIAGLAAGLAEPVGKAMGGDIQGAIAGITFNYTGYNVDDGSWDPMRLTRGLVPLVAGLLVHKFVGGSPLNLNRTLASAGVPFIRI